MIAEDVQRKLWFWGLIGAFILGILFLVWAIFLNRGTIILHAKAPYTFTIEGLRTENCGMDECATVVAPGNYSITIQKQGYASVNKTISVPLGHPYEDNITLQYIPAINKVLLPKEQIFPPNPMLTAQQRNQLGIGSSTQLFFDQQQKFLAYIMRDPQNFRQTLYLASLSPIDATKKTNLNQNQTDNQNSPGIQGLQSTQGGQGLQNAIPTQQIQNSPKPIARTKNPQEQATIQIGTPQLVTSFLRDLQNYIVVPDSAGDKIGVIDQTPDGSTIYVVDLKAKNRASLVNYPVIRDMRWLPDSNDFLFLARPTNDTAETVFVYRWDEGKTYQLDLKTSLDDIAIIDRNHILAITSQKLPDRINNQPWDGQIVPLGENQSTAEVSDNTGLTGAGDSADSTAQTASYNAPTYAFVDFSLIANQARLISTLTQNPFPTKIKAEQDNKGLYFLQGDQVSELRFQE